MSDDILHIGRADIHHPKGPLTAEPAAQQPLSREEQPAEVNWRAIAEGRDRELRAVGEARYKAERERDSLARRLNERYQQLEEARTALHQMTQDVARVRADERRRVAEELSAIFEKRAEDERRQPGNWALANDWDIASQICEDYAGVPAERVQDGSTDTTGTPDPQRYWWQHDDCDSGPVAGAADWPGRPCTGCGMSLGGWTRGAPIAAGESVPSLPEETQKGETE